MSHAISKNRNTHHIPNSYNKPKFETETDRGFPEEKKFFINKSKISLKKQQVINLVESVKGIDKSYRLSNIPVSKNNSNLQVYSMDFTPQQLAEMYKCPKIIVDSKQFGTYIEDSKTKKADIKYKTVFYAIAPEILLDKEPKDDKKIPSLYEISITTYKKNPEHYSISIYGIIDGKADGHIFLARLDNNSECFHKENFHTLKEITDQRKKHNVTPDFSYSEYVKFLNRAKDGKDKLGLSYITPFPHLHAINVNDRFKRTPESTTPTFVKKLAAKDGVRVPLDGTTDKRILYQSLNTSLCFILKRFNVSEEVKIFKTNRRIKELAEEIKDTHTISENPIYKNVINVLIKSNNHTNKHLKSPKF